jgi:hypothetical protein
MVGPNITKRMPKKRKETSDMPKPDFNDPGQRKEQIAYLKQELRNTSDNLRNMTRKLKTDAALERQKEKDRSGRSASPRKSGGLIKSKSRKPKKA